MTRSSASLRSACGRALAGVAAVVLALFPAGCAASGQSTPADSAVAAPLPPPPPAPPPALWIELERNQNRLTSEAAIAAVVDSAAAAGFRQIIVEVKRSDGAVVFPSDHAPPAGLGFDYFGAFRKAAARRGLTTVAHLRVFAEGNTKTEKGPAYDHPEWQTVVQAAEQGGLQPQSQFARKGPILYVNPCLPAVQQYESLVIEDLLRAVKPEAVLLEDLRFFSPESDFSDSTRVRFERWSGFGPGEWPGSLLDNTKPRYAVWMAFRVGVIREFAGRLRALRDNLAPGTKLLLAAPGYYEPAVSVGVNWAHPDYKPNLWYANERFQRAGLAGLFDGVVVMNRDSNPAALREVIRGAKTITWNHAPLGVLVTSDQYPRRGGRFRECLQVIRDAGLGVVVAGLGQMGPQGFWDIVREELPAGR